MPLIHRLNRLHNRPARNELPAQDGLLGVSRTQFFKNFLLRDPSNPFVPGTNVRRLQTVPLGIKAVGVLDAEVRRIVEELRCCGARKRGRAAT
jgi:hypothetical protein